MRDRCPFQPPGRCVSNNLKIHDMVLENLATAVPKDVLFQDLGEEVVLLEVESGQYYGLNEVGARMWSLL